MFRDNLVSSVRQSSSCHLKDTPLSRNNQSTSRILFSIFAHLQQKRELVHFIFNSHFWIALQVSNQTIQNSTTYDTFCQKQPARKIA